MDTLFQDIRFAARTLRKSPGFALLTIACLSLGIGVNSTIYSIVDTIVVRPLPFRDPQALVRVTPTKPAEGIRRAEVSSIELDDWRERSHVFDAMGGADDRRVTLADRDEPERVIA